MAKYRKKSVVVEVTGQFFHDKKPYPEGVIEFKHVTEYGEWGSVESWEWAYYVTTIHLQNATVVDGDWIIQEPDSIHRYPCKPDIFEQTYEKVED